MISNTKLLIFIYGIENAIPNGWNVVINNLHLIWISTNDCIHSDCGISWNNESNFLSCWVDEGGLASRERELGLDYCETCLLGQGKNRELEWDTSSKQAQFTALILAHEMHVPLERLGLERKKEQSKIEARMEIAEANEIN